MRLTDDEIRNVNLRDNSYKVFDGHGLFLLVTPAGRKWWRLKYRFGGKERQAAPGVYPDVSLSDARLKSESLRALLADGTDPSEHIKMERAVQRAEMARRTAAMRFTLDNSGALSFRLGNRRLVLTPAETAELRDFLDATKAVTKKVEPCR